MKTITLKMDGNEVTFTQILYDTNKYPSLTEDNTHLYHADSEIGDMVGSDIMTSLTLKQFELERPRYSFKLTNGTYEVTNFDTGQIWEGVERARNHIEIVTMSLIRMISVAKFRTFTSEDWDYFAGCESNFPLIANLGDFIIIKDGELSYSFHKVDEEGETVTTQLRIERIEN